MPQHSLFCNRLYFLSTFLACPCLPSSHHNKNTIYFEVWSLSTFLWNCIFDICSAIFSSSCLFLQTWLNLTRAHNAADIGAAMFLGDIGGPLGMRQLGVGYGGTDWEIWDLVVCVFLESSSNKIESILSIVVMMWRILCTPGAYWWADGTFSSRGCHSITRESKMENLKII